VILTFLLENQRELEHTSLTCEHFYGNFLTRINDATKVNISNQSSECCRWRALSRENEFCLRFAIKLWINVRATPSFHSRDPTTENARPSWICERRTERQI